MGDDGDDCDGDDDDDDDDDDDELQVHEQRCQHILQDYAPLSA